MAQNTLRAHGNAVAHRHVRGAQLNCAASPSSKKIRFAGHTRPGLLEAIAASPPPFNVLVGSGQRGLAAAQKFPWPVPMRMCGGVVGGVIALCHVVFITFLFIFKDEQESGEKNATCGANEKL